MGRARFDSNYIPSLIAVSNADGTTPVELWADPATHGLIISASLSISGADGAIVDGSNSSIRATVASLTNAKALAVEIVDGSGTQITSFGGGTQYATGATQATPTGTVALGWDGANVQALKTTSSGNLILGAGSAVIGHVITDSGSTTAVTGTVAVSGTFWQTTQPVSGSVTANIGTSGSLALDASVTGLQVAQASTTSGQKGGLVLGAVTTAAPSYTTAQSSPLSLTTAGSLRVDGSGATQPVSGSVTANIGTSGSLALDATLTGGTAKSIIRSGTKGTSSAADVTSTASGSNHQPLDVAIYDASGSQITSFGGGTQYATGSAQATPTGTVALGWDGSNVKALPLDASGFLKVNVAAGGGSGGTSSSFGSAIPSTGTAVGFSDGTNMQLGKVFDTDTGAGTEYTVGTQLRAAASGGSVAIGGSAANGLSVDPTRPPVDGTATGTITASGNTVSITADGYSTIAYTTSGTWVGTLLLEISEDGTTYSSAQAVVTPPPYGSGGGTLVAFGGFTTNGRGSLPIGGNKFVRIRATAWTSGTATITFYASTATPAVQQTSVTAIDSTSNTTLLNIEGANASADARSAMRALGTIAQNYIYDGSNFNRTRSIVNATNSNGLGIQAAGVLAQFDDVSPTSITENQFGNLRMSANRNLYGTIRDAAGNERGANVNASNQLSVSVDNNPVLGASTNTIGDVNLTAAARGGYTVNSQTALTTTATVTSAAGKFGGAMFINLNSAPAYIQVFDTAGAVTLGVTTPTFVIPIPANSTPANGIGFVMPLDVGMTIANGIKAAATTTATGSTTVSTGLTGFFYAK